MALSDALNLRTSLPVNDKYEGAHLLRPAAAAALDKLARVPPWVQSASTVQTITLTGVPTGHSWTPSYLGVIGTITNDTVVGGLDYAAPATGAGSVQTQLQTITGLGSVTVAGSNGGPYTVTMTGVAAPVELIQMAANNLTGGTNPSVAIMPIPSSAGYDPLDGLIFPDRTYVNKPAVAEAYELHWHGFDPTVDLTHFINEALLAAYAVTEVTVPTTPQFFRTSLASLAWLTNPKDVYQVGWLAPSETRDIWDPFESRALRGEVIREGSGSLYVQHTGRAFSGLETLYLRVKQPLYYGTSTGAGLSADSDTCWAPVQWITAGALVQAWFEFPLIMEQGADQRRVTQQQAAQMMWNAMSARWFIEPPHTIEPIEFLGLNLGHAGLVW